MLEVGLALATLPQLLLLDEPLAGTGRLESERMVELIDGLRRRTTVLLVEHDVEAVFRLADRVTVLVNGRAVALSRIQFAILETLMRHANQTLSREQLLDAAFEGDYDGYDRSLDAHIRRLRQRVEHDTEAPRHIVTVYGVGYKFMD